MAMAETITWKPIETAPKDGRLVLLCGGEWCNGFDFHKSPSVAFWKRETWVTMFGLDFVVDYENPTHLAELPVGPTN